MNLDDELRTFLQQRHIARVTTIGPDGYPHTVPIWYILDGDDLVIATGLNTRKLKNIRANPKGAIAIGGDPVNNHERYTAGPMILSSWISPVSCKNESAGGARVIGASLQCR